MRVKFLLKKTHLIWKYENSRYDDIEIVYLIGQLCTCFTLDIAVKVRKIQGTFISCVH